MTASRIEATFDVAASNSLTDEQKRRIISRLGPRVVAVAQDERSQTRNRELALERLAAACPARCGAAPAPPDPADQGVRGAPADGQARRLERKRARRRGGGPD